MKKISIVLLIGLANLTVQGQSLLKKIPSTCNFLMEINIQEIKSNLGENVKDLNEDFRFPVIDGTRVSIKELLSESKAGVNTESKMYFFVDGRNSVWLIPLSNADLFKKTVIENLDPYLKEGEAMPMFYSDKKDQVLHRKNKAVVISKDLAVIIEGPSVNRYGYYGNYAIKEKLKDYMRAEGITNTDDYVSPKMQAKIKELIEEQEAKDLIEEEEERQRIKEEQEAIASGKNTEEAETEVVENEIEVVADAMEETIEAAAEVEEEEYYYEWSHVVLREFDKEWEHYKDRKIERKYQESKATLISDSREYKSMKSKKSIANNSAFKQKFESSHAVGVFMNAAFPATMNKGLYGFDRTMREAMSVLDGNYNVFYMDVKDQSLVISGNQYIKKEFSSYETIKSKPINQTIFKYLPSSTFGYASINFDLNETYNMSYDMYGKILKNIELEKGVDFSGTLDLFDMFINKDMLINTFEGDGIIALTGTSEFIGTRSTYEFDTVSYKSKWKEVPDTSTIPEIMAFFTIKNKKNLMRFLESMDKLKVLKLEGDVYKIDMDYGYQSKSDIELKRMWTIGVDGDVFYITNRRGGVVKKINEESKIDSELLSVLKENGNSMYYDHQAGMRLFPKDEIKDRSALHMLQLSTKYFYNAKMVSKKEGPGNYSFNASFNFDPQNKGNALIQMLHWMQEMDERH